MSKQINLQDVFLNKVRRDEKEVNILMQNGIEMKGVIKGFDNFIILTESGQIEQMIYKHSIASIKGIFNTDC
ncbi:MAG: RNA chaperone Hfq [Clostridiales bacterium]|jgi:host factor-I protein|nr:RNA chaperone Hfq [Clostridiales bacterium]